MNTLSPSLEVPDPRRLSAVQRLGELPDPFAVGEHADETFVSAMRELVSWHQAESEFYARYLALKRFSPDEIRSLEDCARIPPIHANFFKKHEVLSVPRDTIVHHRTSSGTTGQKSQIFLDRWSAGTWDRMHALALEHLGLAPPKGQSNCLLFSYGNTPEAGETLPQAAYTFHFLKDQVARPRRTYTALESGDFDVMETIRTLQAFEEEGLPVALIGFPAFMHFTLEKMREMGLPALQLHPKSLVMTGGGWKNYADQAIPKLQFFGRLHEQLGVPLERCRDGYGAIEAGVMFFECERHHHHVPLYSRVWSRDVKTLEPLGFGEEGFAHVVAGHRTSVPVPSVLLSDLITVHPGSSCGCGIETAYVCVSGRAGTSKNRSCAIAASEILKGQSA